MNSSSLEGIINFSDEPPLGEDERANAKRRFYHIINHFQATTSGDPYNRPLLVRLTYEYSLSEKSQDTFLRAFFQHLAVLINGDEDTDLDDASLEDLRSALIGFAEYLLDSFSLPLKALPERRRNIPLYTIHQLRNHKEDVRNLQGRRPACRLSGVRGLCLMRDRHRCIISRRFNVNEAIKRMERNGDDARDDDGNMFGAEPFEALQVAHIPPHSLTHVKTANSQLLDHSKRIALEILNMFDVGVVHLIEGTDIDRPRNAITLTRTLHVLFGSFRVFFEAYYERAATYLPDQDISPARHLARSPPCYPHPLPHRKRTIDPPSPRLFAVHRAIAHILHLSAAGEYLDKVLRDMKELAVRTDGSTELSRLVGLRLGGWLDGAVH